jgi:hypothetical protein
MARILHHHASNDMQYTFVRGGGVTSLAYLLLRMSPHHLTRPLVEALVELASCLKLNHSQEYERAVIEPLFLNFHLWIYAPCEVQRYLFKSVLSPYMATRPWVRTHFGVEFLLEQMRRYYWEQPHEHALAQQCVLHPITREVVGKRPATRAERDELRACLVKLIECVMQDAPTLDEIKTLLYTHTQHFNPQ